MTHKTEAAYQHVLNYIHKTVISLNGKQYYEYALGTDGAVIKILHCWFHFVQACERKVKKNQKEVQEKYQSGVSAGI